MLTLRVGLLVVAAMLLTPWPQISRAHAQAETLLSLPSLIGKYEGEWKHSAFWGRAELEITAIEAGLLKGRIIYYGSGATSRWWWPFQDGKIDGTRFSFTTAKGGFEFDVEPNTKVLSGRSLGLAANADFTFRKTK